MLVQSYFIYVSIPGNYLNNFHSEQFTCNSQITYKNGVLKSQIDIQCRNQFKMKLDALLTP